MTSQEADRLLSALDNGVRINPKICTHPAYFTTRGQLSHIAAGLPQDVVEPNISQLGATVQQILKQK